MLQQTFFATIKPRILQGMDKKLPKHKKTQKTADAAEDLPNDAQITGIEQAPPIIEDDKPVVKVRPDPPAEYRFKPGQSGNPSGRPRDIVREIGKRIASAKANKSLKPKERKVAEDLGFDTNDLTLLEHIMLSLATSKNPLKIQMFFERVYGKVPNININAEVNAALVTRFRSKFTDAELEDIASGSNPMDILLDKLPDIDDAPRLDANIIDVDEYE